MNAKNKYLTKRVTANYWFFPALFSILAALLALTMVALDRAGASAFLSGQDWLAPARPSGAADMLGVMAGSMIGIAATIFSITIAAVAYASGNYGPRLLTNFMEDRGNQLSLATFIGTFVYALIVLRSVRSVEKAPLDGVGAALTVLPEFAPQLSLLVAYLLMAICVGVLVYFLNHIPSSIRINKVLEGIGNRLLRAIQETYPVEDENGEAPQSQGGDDLVAWDTGYVQLIDFEVLEEIAREEGAIISLVVRTGDFVHRDLSLLRVKDADVDALESRLRDCFTLGPSRTPEQDPQFLIDELVEIGLRALSPGINDPFTTITALHWLGAATAEIARRDLRKDVCGTAGDNCPVIPRADDFAHYTERGFGSIRSAVATNLSAAQTMLEALENAALPIRHPRRRDGLRREADRLMAQARESLAGPDLEAVEERYRLFQQRIPAKQLRAAS